ncbi:MAG: hypothetical protein V7703_21725, partial [Hyphomicrobiales bacterium]
SLIRRHREDDPTDWDEDNMFGILNASDGGACVPKTGELVGEGPISQEWGSNEGYNTCTEEYFYIPPQQEDPG